MTSAGTAPDLTAAADVLGRAADRLEKLATAATPGPWCFYGDNLWTGTPEALVAYDADPENVEWPYDDLGPRSGHLFLGDPHRPADAEFIATMDPRAVAALVPALRAANLIVHFSKSVPCADCAAQPDPDCKHADLCALVGPLVEFARRVLREEETGVLPVDAEWEHAERAYDAAQQALTAAPPAAVPQPIREAVDALGGLISVWQGYGEDDDG